MLIISASYLLPIYAGEFETALDKQEKIFLYLTSPYCGYCVKFNSTYNKLAKNYGNKLKFIKLDITTPEGAIVAKSFKPQWVPYVLLIDGKTKDGNTVPTNCLMKQACSEYVVNEFINK